MEAVGPDDRRDAQAVPGHQSGLRVEQLIQMRCSVGSNHDVGTSLKIFEDQQVAWRCYRDSWYRSSALPPAT